MVVQARSAIGIAQVEFAPVQSGTFKATPAAGVGNAVRIRVRGEASEVQASLVNGGLQPIARLPREASETTDWYISRFTPGTEGFRVLIVGKDAQGFAFQRMYAPLLTPMR